MGSELGLTIRTDTIKLFFLIHFKFILDHRSAEHNDEKNIKKGRKESDHLTE